MSYLGFICGNPILCPVAEDSNKKTLGSAKPRKLATFPRLWRRSIPALAWTDR